MNSGLHPVSGAFLGVPTPLGDPAESLFIYLDPPPQDMRV